MDARDFKSRLHELEKAIESLPKSDRDQLRMTAASTRRRHDEIKEAIRRRCAFLDSLNLALNYLLFDLEVTKRENALMKMRLSGTWNGGDGPARPSN